MLSNFFYHVDQTLVYNSVECSCEISNKEDYLPGGPCSLVPLFPKNFHSCSHDPHYFEEMFPKILREHVPLFSENKRNVSQFPENFY